jgi:hypothetical protein
MENFVRGKLEVQKLNLASLRRSNQIRIAGVDLPVPKQIKANLPDQPEQLVGRVKVCQNQFL